VSDHDVGLSDPHEIAQAEIEAWRGRMIGLYTRCEHAISKTLVAATSSDQLPKLPNLASQRVTALEKALAKLTLPAKISRVAPEALQKWRNSDADRNFLAHGLVSATIDKNGRWMATFEMLLFDASQTPLRRWSIWKREAEERELDLKTQADELCTKLGNVRSVLKPYPAGADSRA
jgi:hypothetical protein